VSLCRSKIYSVIKPLPGDPPYDLRIVDEEGEDYLYPADRFVVVSLPPKARRLLGTALK
jgi:hypothetical protein